MTDALRCKVFTAPNPRNVDPTREMLITISSRFDKTLGELMRLPTRFDDAIEAAAGAVSCLHRVNQKNLYHLDTHENNVMVTGRGKKLHTFIIDWGFTGKGDYRLKGPLDAYIFLTRLFDAIYTEKKYSDFRLWLESNKAKFARLIELRNSLRVPIEALTAFGSFYSWYNDRKWEENSQNLATAIGTGVALRAPGTGAAARALSPIRPAAKRGSPLALTPPFPKRQALYVHISPPPPAP